VKGVDYVESKYYVSEEKRKFSNRWSGEYEAYEVLEKGSVEGELDDGGGK